MTKVALTVNGVPREADVEPRLLLAYFLRNELGLVGTNVGCDTSSCGACTVLVDGEAVFSCVTPVLLLAGRSITTAEGLGTIDHPGPLQRAFIEEQAAQCGFCIPGMMMRAEALLRRRPHASDVEIRDWMQPNLCRCGTHMRILRAVHRAARMMQTAERAPTGLPQ